jgi:hypothetical protein
VGGDLVELSEVVHGLIGEEPDLILDVFPPVAVRDAGGVNDDLPDRHALAVAFDGLE